MTFKEQLKNDIDRLGTTEEFRNSLSEMLYEQAEKPKPKLYISAVRYGAVAAAVCLLAFGAVKLGLFGENAIDTTSTASGNEAAVRAADIAETAAETTAAQVYENYEEAESGNGDDFSGGVMYAAPAADEIYPEAAEADGESKEEAYVGAAENSEDYADDEVSIDSVCDAEAPAADEADEKSVDDACGIFSTSISTESTELSAYDMPVYGKEAIYAKTTIYSADRPWYDFDETAKRIRENSNYKLARVVFGEQLTADEAAQQPFVNAANGGTYYRAWVNGEEATVFFFGTAQIQESGNPVYADGDEIYCALEERSGIYLIREYPLGDIYTINGEECIYLRIQPYEINAEQLISSKTEVVTTTADNAAVYYSAYRLEDFQRELANAVENNY